jgi:hypothetical protein
MIQERSIPHFLSKGEFRMAKKTKKDGSTKQKGKSNHSQKTSGSANGSNGYH